MNLNENYSRDDFLIFLNSFIPNFKKDVKRVDVRGLKVTKEAFYLGESEELDLAIFELTHNSSADARITLATDGFRVMKDSASYRALVIYSVAKGNDWRLSLMTASPDVNQQGKVGLTLSNPRRFSFFLGPNAKINTPYQYLIKQTGVNDFEELQKRFSVEVVNKEFYKEIANLYTKLVGGVRGDGRNRQEFSGFISLPSVPKESRLNHEFTVRLIGRIIFCWFLREKRSESGQSLISNELLSLNSANDIPDYYHSILEPLFFEILNKSLKSRKEKYQEKPYKQIPYLNGGLFSPQDDDYYSFDEGRQATNHNTLVIPDEWLREFFEVLERYNFTVDENTNIDIDLSIDPEMLGRIFENLLAEINPETGESARKSTGSYYTPRTIVEYMVDESLYQYLKSKTDIVEVKLRALISYDLSNDEELPLSSGEKEKVVEALSNITILDPACGSGAFPIGALQKIVFMLQRLDPNGQLWFKRQIENSPPEIRRVIEREFAYKNFDYIRKLGIIRKSIFGVDIQPVATEIARLRCFLTLVVEERVADEESNRGIEPLPNLDFKFVTANTLIGLSANQQNGQTELFEDQEGIDQLKEVRDMYFTASGTERENLKTKFAQIQNKMFQKMITHHYHADLTRKLSVWDPFGHEAADWFDSDWMFGIKEGFDVVIANPPYIQIQKMSGQSIQELYAKSGYQTFTKTGDLYCLFYERGLTVSKKSTGILCYITSNKWMRAAYGEKLRQFFLEHDPINLVDFGGIKIFEATVNTNILLINNRPYSGSSKGTAIKSDFILAGDLLNYVHENSTSFDITSSNGWYIASKEEIKLREKVEKAGKQLKEWDINIYRGILTGFNEAFIIDGQTRSRLINADSRSSGIIRPILRGKDIVRFGYEFGDIYLLNTGYDLDVPKLYPAIYKHLLQFKENAEKRQDQGKNWWNLRACDYYEEFEKEKIAWIDLSDKGRFSKIKQGIYLDKTSFFLTGENIDYLLAVLNSKLINWYLDTICNSSGVGTNLWSKISVEALPIPIITEANSDLIKKLVGMVTPVEETYKLAVSKMTELEKQIDQLVYKLYGLTPEEIKIVGSS